MTAPGPGHSSALRGVHAVCGGINSVLLATSVRDALRMGYLLLFIMKAPAQQWGLSEPELGPCPPASLPLLPILLPARMRGCVCGGASLGLGPSQKGRAGYVSPGLRPNYLWRTCSGPGSASELGYGASQTWTGALASCSVSGWMQAPPCPSLTLTVLPPSPCTCTAGSDSAGQWPAGKDRSLRRAQH